MREFHVLRSKTFHIWVGFAPTRIFHCNISTLVEILLRLLADISENTAVDIKDVTVYEIGSVGCEEYGRT